MNEAQSKIRTIIYSIFAFIISMVLIRLLLKLIGAEVENEFVNFWYDLSDIFVEPWNEIYPSMIDDRIETYSIVALLFYMLISFVVTKSAISAFEDTRKQAIVEIVDSLFKIAEFLLITRFIFKITDASDSASFVDLIYSWSNVVYEPFASILPAQEIGGIVLEVSTIVALVVIIILDMATEQFVVSVLNAIFPDKKRTLQQRPPTAIQQQPMPVQQPQAPQQPIYVDQRQINLPPNNPLPTAGGQHAQQPGPPVQPQKRGFLQHPKPRSSRQGGPADS